MIKNIDRIIKTWGRVIAFFAVAIAAQTSVGQDNDSLMVDLGDCIGLTSPVERFACYEAQVNAALTRNEAATTPIESRERTEEVVEPIAAPSDARNPDSRGSRNDEPTRVAGAESAPEAARVASPAAAPAPAPEPTRVARSLPTPDPMPSPPPPPSDIESTVASLRETVPNSYLITLENGQVWRQTLPKVYRLRAGHRVRLYPAPLGTGFRLSAEDLAGFIRVERVR